MFDTLSFLHEGQVTVDTMVELVAPLVLCPHVPHQILQAGVTHLDTGVQGL